MASTQPLLPAAYVWLLRRRRKQARALQQHGVVRAATGPQLAAPRAARALLLLGLAGLLFAAARPVARVPLPWARTSIMLAIDVSLSMRVNDVKPTRMEAAQEAAKSFLRDLPRDVEVGSSPLPAAARSPSATLDRDSLVTAIDAFQMQMGTAVGSAIVVSLAELFPDHGLDVGEMTFGNRKRAAQPGRQGQAAAQADHAGAARLVQVGRDHPAERRPPHHRRRHAGSGADGRRPRRAHLRGRAGHRGGSASTPEACRSTCSSTNRPCAKWRA
jgi:hypothetical protein